METSVIWSHALAGAITLGFAISGLFFLRFWVRTGDRLFAMFALAFWVLMCERLLLIALGAPREISPYIYLVRLAGFLIIIYAIVHKNRKQSR
jgi:hypothetical protein